MTESNSNRVSETTIQELKAAFVANPIHQRVFDLLASGKIVSIRDQNRPVTQVDEVLDVLGEQKNGNSRAAVVALLQRLCKLRLGEFVIGRRNLSSRIIWNADPVSVGRAAQGQIGEIEISHVSEAGAKAIANPMIKYDFQLRDYLSVSFNLPVDLSREEADRLSVFIKNCLITK